MVFGLDDSDYTFLIVTDTLGGTKPTSYQLGGRATTDAREILTQPLAAFPDGGALMFRLARSDSRHDAIAPLLTMVGALPWELRGADAAGDHFLADIEGIPFCARELDVRGALCVEHGPSGSRLWRAASARSVSLVTDLPLEFDLVRAVGNDRVVAAERFGSRAAVVDAVTRKAFRLTLPVPDARLTGRSTVDLAARGDYLLVLFTNSSGATVMRFRIE